MGVNDYSITLILLSFSSLFSSYLSCFYSFHHPVFIFNSNSVSFFFCPVFLSLSSSTTGQLFSLIPSLFHPICSHLFALTFFYYPSISLFCSRSVLRFCIIPRHISHLTFAQLFTHLALRNLFSSFNVTFVTGSHFTSFSII